MCPPTHVFENIFGQILMGSSPYGLGPLAALLRRVEFTQEEAPLNKKERLVVRARQGASVHTMSHWHAYF